MLRIGVIMGGDSSEREVSIMSGTEFIKHLDKSKYDVLPIVIDRPKDLLNYMNQMDVALLALHGKNGEDGRVQALLEALEIPYSGSGIVGSALCMDKNMSKLVMQTKHIDTPHWVLAKKNIPLDLQYFEGLTLPVIVKPNQGGSSIGIHVVDKLEAIIPAINDAFLYDEEVIVENYIKGQEITCSMLNGQVIPVLSIKPNVTFFNYEEKYAIDANHDELVQLETHIDTEILSQVSDVARLCWDIFNLKSYARIDMMVEHEKIYVIEINTLPGMTPYSLLPKSAHAMGLTYSQVLDNLIDDAISTFSK